VELDQDVIIS
jgi:hypothetical protein